MAASPELILNVETVQLAKLDLKPGDSLIVSYPSRLSTAQAAHVRETVGKYFPGHNCLVLEGGMTLGVLREGADEPVYLEAKENQ
jgi:hypothetical protein